MEEQKKYTHGGKREGAGRKKSPIAQKAMSLRLDHDLAEIFEKSNTINKNNYINLAVRQKMMKDKLLE